MGVYYPPAAQHDTVITTALRVINATHYFRAEDPHADAEQEYSQEQLALTARALADAVDRMPADEQPIGWSKDRESTDAAPRPAASREELEQLVQDLTQSEPCDLDHNGACQAHWWFPTDDTPCPHGRAQALFPDIKE